MSKRAAPAAKPAASKKLRNTQLTAKLRAEQYPNDYYASGQQLFCKFCQHTIDWSRKDTCNDHLKSKVHQKNKTKSSGRALQVSLDVASKSQDCRREFVEDFVAMCTEADIPLEKMRKMRPFVLKHCKQGGALPENPSSLRQIHLQQVFNEHMQAVLQEIRDKVFVVVDETSDNRDCSVLNIVIGE